MDPAAAHVFVDDLDALELGDDDAHHLRRVLRLRAGEAVTAADNRGSWRPCVVGRAGTLEAAGPVAVVEPAAPAVEVALPALKGDRTEWAVQKLTEVGVDGIRLVVPARAVVRWEPDRTARNLERLRRVAREAAMQSRRLSIPTVAGPATTADVVASGFALAHPGGRPPALDAPAVAVGPEGGWTEEEVAAAGDVVGLGPTVLRAETAAVVAATLLCGLRSGIVTERD